MAQICSKQARQAEFIIHFKKINYEGMSGTTLTILELNNVEINTEF